MMKFNHITVLSLSAILLCNLGCKQTDVDDEQLLVNANCVTFEAAINDVTTRSSDSSFEEGDQISVTAYCEDGSTLKSNAQYTYSNNVFSSVNAIAYPERGDELSFLAVYPYMTVSNNEASFSVETDQTSETGYTLSDMMSSRLESTTSISPTLTFDHLMSKIIINVATINLGDITSVSTTLHAITSATFDLTDGGSTLSSNTSSDIKMANNGNGTDSFKAIIPAQSIAANATMATITINGVDYELQYPSAQNYEQGTQYTYSATISEGEVIFELAAIVPWEQEAIAYEINEDGLRVYRVANIVDMLPYFEQDSVYVILKQGTYEVVGDDITTTFTKIANASSESTWTRSLFLVEGNYSTYDFNGSTINVDIESVYSVTGSAKQEFFPLHFLGNWNTVKNYTQVDVGDDEDYASSGCTNAVMDGAYNTIYNIEIQSKGSYPYGYGECFGKGSGYVIKHFKHCGLLVRGNYNLVDYCRIYHKAYGHVQFQQAAWCPTIRNCYFEGEMGSTDFILDDKRSNGADGINMNRASDVNWFTEWGYTVPAGYTIALTEDCLRAYTSGSTMVDGARPDRNTGGIYAHDNIVTEARSGTALTLGGGINVEDGITGFVSEGTYYSCPEWYTPTGTGAHYAERIVVLGCDSGLAAKSGCQLVDCYADAQHGPAISMAYDTDSNITAEVTLLPFELANSVYSGYTGTNGSGHAVFVMGSGHNITFDYQDSYSFTQAGVTMSGSVNDSRFGWSRDNEPLTINLGGNMLTTGKLYVSIDDMSLDEINAWFGTSYTEAPTANSTVSTNLLVLDGDGNPVEDDENHQFNSGTITNNTHLLGSTPYKIVLNSDTSVVYSNTIKTGYGEVDVERNGNYQNNTVTTLGSN